MAGTESLGNLPHEDTTGPDELMGGDWAQTYPKASVETAPRMTPQPFWAWVPGVGDGGHGVGCAHGVRCAMNRLPVCLIRLI